MSDRRDSSSVHHMDLLRFTLNTDNTLAQPAAMRGAVAGGDRCRSVDAELQANRGVAVRDAVEQAPAAATGAAVGGLVRRGAGSGARGVAACARGQIVGDGSDGLRSQSQAASRSADRAPIRDRAVKRTEYADVAEARQAATPDNPLALMLRYAVC